MFLNPGIQLSIKIKTSTIYKKRAKFYFSNYFTSRYFLPKPFVSL